VNKVYIVRNVADVISNVEEIKELHFDFCIVEFNHAQELEHSSNNQANTIEGSNNVGILIPLHLSNEASTESNHINPEEPSKVDLCINKLSINNSLQANVVLDIISELRVDFRNNFLNRKYLIFLYWFL